MPLSDREERILQELERNLYAEDPKLGRKAKPRSAYGEELARLKIAVGVFLVGLGVLITFFFSRSLILGVLAFGGMVAAIVLGAAAVRGLVQASKTGVVVRQQRLHNLLAHWEQRLRDRYRRP